MPDDITIRKLAGAGRGKGFIRTSESTADIDAGSLDIEAIAKRCLRIVEICLDTHLVSADELVDDVPESLAEEIVTQKAD